MSSLNAHAIFNCTVGADQAGPALATGDSVLFFLGGNLTAAAATSTLTVFDGAAGGNVVLLTLSCVANSNAGGVLPSSYAVKAAAGLHYTLAGASATAQLYWQTG